MLEEKRKDLDTEKQKALLQRMLTELSRANPDLYYRSTSEIASYIERYVAEEASLLVEERALLERLNQRDIQILLSLN
ncbi:hypothetical protein SAMN05421757_10517 [Tropicimonas sediminicola]|uniref:Uncharacterized protein n=2 Tax=Tropicimonas sediminicola TaxID=1031541 RepID=A0A239IYI4_9RHOB|nr:hypothetical protein SAMN05421757_10517 [Tropicimonas sediminicola]